MKKLLCTTLLFLLEIIAPKRLVPPGLAAFGVVSRFKIFNDGLSVEEMTARLVEIKNEAEAIKNLATSQNRNLSAEEETQLTTLLDEFDNVKAQRTQRERIDNMSFDLGGDSPRRTAPVSANARAGQPGAFDDDAAGQGNQRQGYQVTQNTPEGQWGFHNLGDFAQCVSRAARHAGVDNRLERIIQDDADVRSGIRGAASDTALERIGEEGGFLIPPDFREMINQQVASEESLMGRTNPIPISGNQFVANLDETTPWQTSGGILAYWEGEGNQYQASRPKIAPTTVRANKLTALVIATDELLEDATALGAYIGRKAPEKIDFKCSLAIFNGSGAGQPAGLLAANSTAEVAKESGQAADTIVYENINKMYSTLYAQYLNNAVWLVNQDVLPELENMTADGAAGGHPVFVAGGTYTGGAAATPFSTLKGRPIIVTEVCETLGDKGDIMLVDLAQYLCVIKSGGVRSDASIHLYFDYGETAFRFTTRVGGQSWWPNKITKRAGGQVAPAVVLAERA